MTTSKRRSFIVGAGAVAASGISGCSTQAKLLTENSSPTLTPRAYSLQSKVEGLAIPEAITVIGCGGFGTWPALFSAICGVKKMLLIDASDVDEVDMARTPFRPIDIGKGKAAALREIILVFRPDVEIRTEKRFIEPTDNNVFFGSVLFDGTNYKPLSKSLPNEAKKRGLKYVHGFYNGNVVGTSDHYIDAIDYIPGNEIPVWAGGATLAAAMAMFSAFVSPINFIGMPSSLSMNEQKFGSEFQALGGMRVDK